MGDLNAKVSSFQLGKSAPSMLRVAAHDLRWVHNNLAWMHTNHKDLSNMPHFTKLSKWWCVLKLKPCHDVGNWHVKIARVRRTSPKSGRMHKAKSSSEFAPHIECVEPQHKVD